LSDDKKNKAQIDRIQLYRPLCAHIGSILHRRRPSVEVITVTPPAINTIPSIVQSLLEDQNFNGDSPFSVIASYWATLFLRKITLAATEATNPEIKRVFLTSGIGSQKDCQKESITSLRAI
jgi:hypothetical protein